ncbi:hypothetical protein ABZ442_32955 [Streptomyces triculaminicus]|uniref:hypothetical protein n=1 Tax=Streptomyces triculaminicus TaxID=2816232 RepID=UPI00340548C9
MRTRRRLQRSLAAALLTAAAVAVTQLPVTHTARPGAPAASPLLAGPLSAGTAPAPGQDPSPGPGNIWD